MKGEHQSCRFPPLILPNTQKNDKVKGRKGKRASVLVEFRCARRWSIGVWWWSPFFAIVMLHELLVKMFEGVKSRACPGVGISKVSPQRPIQKHEEVIEAKRLNLRSHCKKLPCQKLEEA